MFSINNDKYNLYPLVPGIRFSKNIQRIRVFFTTYLIRVFRVHMYRVYTA